MDNRFETPSLLPMSLSMRYTPAGSDPERLPSKGWITGNVRNL